MKKTNHILPLFLLLSLFGGVTSCVEINPGEVDLFKEIVWQTVCNKPSTRAASALDLSSTFSTCVWQLGNGETWAANKASALLLNRRAAGEPSGITGTVSYDAGLSKWKIAAGAIYWPEVGNLNFLSYTVGDIRHPSGDGVNPPYTFNWLTNTQKAKFAPATSGLSISNWSSDDDGDKDVIVADMQTDKTFPSSYLGMTGVITEFHHVLSKVNFVFLKSNQGINFTDGNPANTTIRLKRVELQNYWFVGSLIEGGTGSERWTLSAASASNVKLSKVLFNGTQDLDTEDASLSSWESLHIPQDLFSMTKNFGAYTNLAETKIYVEYDVTYNSSTLSKTATISLPANFASTIWEKGKAYTYTLKIGAQLAPIEFTASVGDWIVDTSSLTNGGVLEL